MNAAHLQALLASTAGSNGSAPGLGQRAVTLKNNSDVLRFTSKYAHAIEGSPFDAITFAMGSLTPRAAEALETFLRGPALSIEFTDLVIEKPETLLASSPGLTDAFAGLTCITRLELIGAGQHSRELLRGLKAKLTTVNLVMVPIEDDLDEDDDDWEPTGRNPIALLSNFQDTLESVAGESTETLCVNDITYPQHYPNVDAVFLERTDLPITLHYVQAYPYLTSLMLRTDPEEYVRVLEEDPNELGDRRKINIIEQLQHGSWPSLSECDSTLGTLFVLGLQCHVRDLRILADIAAPDSKMLGSVLMDTRPTVLTLHQFPLDMLSTPSFATVMRGSSVRQLKSLEITLVLDEKSGQGDGIEASFIAMIKALEPLKIEALGLALMCNFRGPYPCESGLPLTRISLGPEEVFLRDLNLDELAKRLRRTMSSLQSVVLTMVAHRTRPLVTATLGDEQKSANLRLFQLAKLQGLMPNAAL